MKCEHVFGLAETQDGGELITRDNYRHFDSIYHIEKFTYCPYCKVQVHTIDGVPLGLPVDYPEDDCIRGGCED